VGKYGTLPIGGVVAYSYFSEKNKKEKTVVTDGKSVVVLDSDPGR
jgi:hypothetical protein